LKLLAALGFLTVSGMSAPSTALGQLSVTVTGTQTLQTLLPGQANALCFTLTISNPNLLGLTLQSVRFTNKSLGPGTQGQLDAELGQPRLYLDTGSGTFQPGTDTFLMQSTAAGGFLQFSGLNVAISAFSSATLFVATGIPTTVRDGDNLDLSIQAASDVTFAQFVATTGNSWPVDPAGSIALDGSSAVQDSVAAVGPGNILAGTNDNLALDVRIPSNGYQTDRLEKLAIVNEGNATIGPDIAAVRAWVDEGDGLFNPAFDRLLGTLSFTGDRWQLTGLSETIPIGGLRTFVSVDLKDFATDGHTVRFAIPTQPDVGIGVASTNDGPLDGVVRNPNYLTVSTSDRITLSATALPSQPAMTGEAGVPLADVVVTNSYSVPRTLSEVAFTNGTAGPGSRTELDSELDRLSLRYDGNGDGVLGTLAEDPLLGTARFQNGEARFTGVAWQLAAGQSRHIFLTGDLSLTGARDGDVLAASIQEPSQVRFDDSTRVLAAWPVDSGAQATVEGMTAAQIAVLTTPAVTLGKNEGPALVFDLVLPRNGYENDVLNGLAVVNLGTGGIGDIAELRLWRDGGDGRFTPGSGDDSDLGPMTWQVDRWQSAALAEPLGGAGARLFLSLTVSGSPVDSTTVRLAIPAGGVVNASGNDGPLDASVTAPNTALLSNAPLLVSIEIQPDASTVGQSLSTTMIVRNVGSEAVDGTTPSALIPSGAGSLSLVTGPQPPSFNLAPGAADSFRWTYTAASAGDVRLTGSAGGTGSPSGSPRSALSSASNTHQVFTQTQSVAFAAASSLPPSVNRGQKNVTATSLEFTSLGGSQSSTVRLLGLRVRLEDGAGAGIVPSDLLGRIVVSEGGSTLLQKTALETSGSVIDLTLATPASIAAGGSATLTVSLDVLSSTTVPEFRLLVTDSTVFSAQDGNSGAPVSVTHSGSYPVRTSVASVVAPATELDFAAGSPSVSRVGRGQTGIPLLGLQLRSPGIVGITSDVRLFSFSAVLEDTNGATVPRPADFLSFLRVETPVQALLTRSVSTAEGPGLVLTLSLPLSVPANTPVDLAIRGDISGTSPIGPVRLRLLDPANVDARDANTRDPVPAEYNPSAIVGNTVFVESRADTLRVAGAAHFPGSSTVGATNVPALRISLRHPGAAGMARIALDGVTLQCRDEARRPVVPSTYLSRVALIWNGALLAEVQNPPSSGGSVTIPLARLLLEPAESDSADVVVDFAAEAPIGSIELMVFGDDLAAEDANIGTHVLAAPEAGGELPLVSGLCRLESPPRDLVVELESRMPAALAPDGRPVVAGVLTLSNTAQAGADSILVDHLVLLAADRQENAAPVGEAAASVAVYVQGALVAQSAALTRDSTVATVSFAPPLRVPPLNPVALELRWNTVRSQVPAAFRLGCEAAGIGVIQPSSALLQVRISPAQGRTFPLWTAAGVFGNASLDESYSNFPNPFAAGRSTTAFAYYLRAAARVTLRIFTPGGEGVRMLVADGARPAGMNESDLWDGRNGRGTVVRNGVYIAELTVAYADGSSDHVRRKVAVVR
jgi:hypothetical protein